jgi:hypothetical protein
MCLHQRQAPWLRARAGAALALGAVGSRPLKWGAVAAGAACSMRADSGALLEAVMQHAANSKHRTGVSSEEISLSSQGH